MSKKNDEDKNPRSRLSRYLRWFSVSKKKDISGLIIVEFERKMRNCSLILTPKGFLI